MAAGFDPRSRRRCINAAGHHDIAGRQNETDSGLNRCVAPSASTLIIKRKKSIIPAVTQRQALADALSRYMGQLGLARRTKLTSLHEILTKDDDHQGTNGTEHNGKD